MSDAPFQEQIAAVKAFRERLVDGDACHSMKATAEWLFDWRWAMNAEDLEGIEALRATGMPKENATRLWQQAQLTTFLSGATPHGQPFTETELTGGADWMDVLAPAGETTLGSEARKLLYQRRRLLLGGIWDRNNSHQWKQSLTQAKTGQIYIYPDTDLRSSHGDAWVVEDTNAILPEFKSHLFYVGKGEVPRFGRPSDTDRRRDTPAALVLAPIKPGEKSLFSQNRPIPLVDEDSEENLLLEDTVHSSIAATTVSMGSSATSRSGPLSSSRGGEWRMLESFGLFHPDDDALRIASPIGDDEYKVHTVDDDEQTNSSSQSNSQSWDNAEAKYDDDHDSDSFFSENMHIMDDLMRSPPDDEAIEAADAMANLQLRHKLAATR